MKTIALLLGCLLLLGGEGRYITWSAEQRLQWAHFQGPIDATSRMTAHTRSRLELHWECNHGQFQFVATAMFDKEGSWSKTDAFDDLLAHEQLHFDIAELYARRMRQHFQLLQNPCGLTDDEIRAEVGKLRKEWHDREERYDEETNHSQNASAQARWTAQVARELRLLERYALK